MPIEVDQQSEKDVRTLDSKEHLFCQVLVPLLFMTFSWNTWLARMVMGPEPEVHFNMVS